MCITTSGCSTGGLGKTLDKTLQAVGIKETPPAGPPTIPIQLFAGTNLNATNAGKPISVVVKVYQLRNTQRFDAASPNSFLDQATESSALGQDLISVNEVVMKPGERKDFGEKLSDGARFIGIVALFWAPAKDRWRLLFDAGRNEVSKEGIKVGIHACALTTNSPALITRLSGDPFSLASVRCDTGR